ncbi:hypothetical protein JOQ06_007886 [Pogonophryne albipinna]|uniref:Pyrin domain-containing protein n=1 Tax=Pogonophryne albipinna TaxID=1090488 RepID=A0AAD6AA03_9TELE|nr:hypothetical protein JOQ06_007886 [Pogonophryne albipinna]
MDLKALETKWRTALSSILDELTGDEFRKLLFNLEKIPQGLKEGRVRGDMPSVIIQHYSTKGSIALMDRLMRKLPRRDAAVQQPLRGMKDELKKLRQKKKGQLSGKPKTRDSQDGKAPWRKSIFDLKSSGILETEAIVGKVVKKSELLTSTIKTIYFFLGVADETASVKLMVYGKDLHRKIKEGSSYIFRNLTQDGIYVKTHVSGTVTEIYPVKKVKVEHKEKKTNQQSFKLRQEAEEISVTMWDEATKRIKDFSVGHVLLLEYMKPNEYCEKVSLNSTKYTKITKVQSVGIRKVTRD